MLSAVIETYVGRLHAATTPDEVSLVVGECLQQFDISMFSAVLVKSQTITSDDDIEWLNNTSAAHFEEYYATNRIADDYGLRMATDSGVVLPFLIGDEFVPEIAGIQENEIDFYKFNSSMGFKSGIGIPMRTQVEGLPSGFSIWSDMSKARFETLLASHSSDILLFLHLAQRKVEASLFVQANNLQPLTDRERDCLALIAQGHRPDRIGDRLCISTATVNFHIKHARRKLSARTNAEAVGKALAYQLI